MKATGQPFVAVDIHLQGERKPRRTPHVDEAELRVKEIEVVDKALAPLGTESRPPVTVCETKCLDRFDRAEHANESALDPFALGNLACKFFLADRAAEITVGAPRALGCGLGMVLEAAGKVESQLLEVLELETKPIYEVLQPGCIADR